MPYLAMTGAEIDHCSELPPKLGYMACHFSSYSTGLSNLPRYIPEKSLLIINDRTPIHGHDPDRICDQLEDILSRFSCRGILLDFQRESEEAPAIIQKLLSLPCPVIVSSLFAEKLDCPIFLPPVPLPIPLEGYLAPFAGREIWLEAALDGLQLTLTEDGCAATPLSAQFNESLPHREEELCCHYRIEITSETAIFTLRRTKEDLKDLLSRANQLGITGAVGLYQELGD